MHCNLHYYKHLEPKVHEYFSVMVSGIDCKYYNLIESLNHKTTLLATYGEIILLLIKWMTSKVYNNNDVLLFPIQIWKTGMLMFLLLCFLPPHFGREERCYTSSFESSNTGVIRKKKLTWGMKLKVFPFELCHFW